MKRFLCDREQGRFDCFIERSSEFFSNLFTLFVVGVVAAFYKVVGKFAGNPFEGFRKCIFVEFKVIDIPFAFFSFDMRK